MELSVLQFIFAVFICVLMYVRSFRKPKHHLPPGPRGLPFLGCLPSLGKHLHKTLSRMAQKYGSIFGLYIGSQYFIVVDDFNAVKEVCTKDEFLNRPPEYFRIAPGHSNIIELSGNEWRDHRRFHVTTLKLLGMTKTSTHHFVLEEIQKVIAKLTEKSSEAKIDFHAVLNPSFDNVIYYILYGKPFGADHPYMKRMDKFVEALSMTYRWEEDSVFKPWLKFLLSTWYSSKKRAYEKEILSFLKIIKKEVQDHRLKLDSQNPKDFIDYFLIEMEKREDAASNGYTDNSLVGNLLSLLGAGSVTTSITLTWFLMSLAKHQKVQEKCYEEIVQFLGPNRDPEVEDRLRLPYLSATIAESQRVNPISYLNLLRQCNTDGATISGYDVPTGTVIIMNLWSINNSKELWGDPENFRPERFLQEEELIFHAPEHLTPFSYGKRQCPGMKLASTQLFLYAASLLRSFKFLPPKDGLNMEEFLYFNVTPSKPFLRFEIRKH